MITRERAVELVEALLLRERQESPSWALWPDVAVCRVVEHDLGWAVSWQSVEYIRGDTDKMLIGHGPYLVDRYDGSIHHIPATTYRDPQWPEAYRRQVKGISPTERPEPPDPLIAALRALVHSDGVLAAVRYLRRQILQLGIQDAKAHVIAIRNGSDSLEELSSFRGRDDKSWLLPISTLAGPVSS
ncbi:YrhB domain-containing protein [Streptomyces halstedii]|uniref:YrhB domain-containing protein n=1 Tax=Streptomyces halstedii TaxID=1944 RepID=UPI0036C3FC3E